MGQTTQQSISFAPTFNVPTTTGTKVVGAGYMGEFGNGLWQVFAENGTFTVPAGVSKIRVRVVGGGGGGRSGGTGGGGGGYAHGVFPVTDGQSFAVTVGLGGTGGSSPTAGRTSSFGALISAAGGAVGALSGSIASGGAGFGGDYQASGGSSGPTAGSGGGGSGSQLGRGGSSNGGVSGGGGIGQAGNSIGSGGGSPFGSNWLAPSSGGYDIIGNSAASGSKGASNPINAVIRFPFDCFTGGGGGGGGTTGSDGGIGGGGGGGSSNCGGGGIGGGGGGGGSFPGGGGIGGGGGSGGGGNNGGIGIVIVEW